MSPAAVTAVPYRNYARWFEIALMCASLVPFIMMMMFAFRYHDVMDQKTLRMFLQYVILINIIHVPATLYLFSDRHIRAMALQFPFRLIAVPLAIIVLGTAVYTTLASSSDLTSQYMRWILLLSFFYWQLWHFGMQSYGVVSFISIASRRPARDKRSALFERRTVMAGAVFGMLAFYQNVHPRQKLKAFQDIDYTIINDISSMIYLIGMVGCYAVSLAAIVYVIRNYQRFTFSSAVIYLVSVCFFLPDYLTFIIPNITPPGAAISYLNFSIVHGLQYMVFLAAHALGSSHNAYSNPRSDTLKTVLAVVMPLLMFAILGLYAAKYISGHGYLRDVGRFLGDMLGSERVSIHAGGFAMALASSHFWWDQYFWKLSNPSQREWIFSRYKFVIPPPRA